MIVPLLSVLRSTSIPDVIEPARGPSLNEQEIEKLETRLSFFRLGSVIVLGFQLVQALRGDYGAIVFWLIILGVLIISDRSMVNKLKKLKSQNGDLP
jgi:hypothetical protein